MRIMVWSKILVFMALRLRNLQGQVLEYQSIKN